MPKDPLTKIYGGFDPLTPASEDYYVDCSDVRGGRAFPRRAFLRRCALELAQSQGFFRFIFSGHVGSGKSSELRQLASSLETLEPAHRFFPVMLDCSQYIEPYDVSASEILLATVAELAEQLKSKLKIRLEAPYFTKRLPELQDMFSQESNRNTELNLGSLKVALIKLRSAPQVRELLRDRLRIQLPTLLEEMERLFVDARSRIQKRGFKDFLLIIDNLDLVKRVERYESGDSSHRALFLESSTIFTDLPTHFVLTIPLTVARSHGQQLESRYGRPPFILPMIKVTDRNGDRYEHGRERLIEIIEKRLHPLTLSEVFEPEALDLCLTYSAGNLRSLIRFIREASLEGDLPVPSATVHRVLSACAANYDSAIPVHSWDHVARLGLPNCHKVDLQDTAVQKLIEQLAILEYVNGGEEVTPFRSLVPWYAVNPLVRELESFHDAIARVSVQLNPSSETPSLITRVKPPRASFR